MINYLLLRDPEGASRERYIKRRRGKVQGFFGKKDFVARWTMKGERSWSRENREGTSARRETACSRSKITEREISKSFIQANKIQPNFICRKKKKKRKEMISNKCRLRRGSVIEFHREIKCTFRKGENLHNEGSKDPAFRTRLDPLSIIGIRERRRSRASQRRFYSVNVVL